VFEWAAEAIGPSHLIAARGVVGRAALSFGKKGPLGSVSEVHATLWRMTTFDDSPRRSLANALAQVRNFVAALATEVDATRNSATFTAALDTSARFWRYSPFNQWLILAQRPTARRVASRRTWQTLGRRVRQGTRPLDILAPATRRRGGPPFVVVPVYDVAQTRGRRVATLDLALKGTAPQARILDRAAAHLGVIVRRAPLPPGVLGRSELGVVTLRPRLPGTEYAATLAHELAHEILHTMRSRGATMTHSQIETEAEATSYVVTRALGLPSKAPAYIAWHGGSGELVLQSMKRVQRAARRILQASEAYDPTRPKAKA
jgi:hypothetical protein